MEALKAAWARVRASAGIFAHSSLTELEAELTALHAEFEKRLAAVEKAVAPVAPAPPSAA